MVSSTTASLNGPASADPVGFVVRRVMAPVIGAVSWTVIGPDRRPVEPVEAFLRWLTDIERSPNTVRAYAGDLRQFWEFLPAARLRVGGYGAGGAGELHELAAQPGRERGGARRW
jgi:hypothetical protein